jgi:hypothetical protein
MRAVSDCAKSAQPQIIADSPLQLPVERALIRIPVANLGDKNPHFLRAPDLNRETPQGCGGLLCTHRVILDHCGFWPMLSGCSRVEAFMFSGRYT